MQVLLENFFITHVPVHAVSGRYIPGLVILSYLIASYAAYTAFTFTANLTKEKRQAFKGLWHMGGAFSLGAGIWAMHFIGMLAYRMDMRTEYDVSLTLLSLLVSIFSSYIALAMVKHEALKWRHFIPAAFLMGIGICVMHYTGMAAMKIDGEIRYLPHWFLLSALVAITVSGAAIWLLFTYTRNPAATQKTWIGLSALVMGAAICGMHYAGMAATVFIPYADSRYDLNQSFEALGGGIALVTLAILLSSQGVERIIGVLERQEIGKRVFTQLLMIVLPLYLMLLVSLFFVFHTLDKQSDDTALMNSLGLQRMLVQRYTRQAIVTLSTEDEGLRHSYEPQLIQTASHIQQNYQSFIEGGLIVLNAEGTSQGYVQQNEYADIRLALPLAQKAWQELNRLFTRMQHGLEPVNFARLAEQSEKAVLLQDSIAQMKEQHIREQAFIIRVQQLAVFIIYTLIYIGLAVYAYRRVAQPLTQTTRELEHHRQNLEHQVAEQTASLQQERNMIWLLQNIATLSNESKTLEEALQKSTNVICRYMKWPVGHAFIVDAQTSAIQSPVICYLADLSHTPLLKKASEAIRSYPDIGLPGRVLATGVPVWLNDLQHQPDFSQLPGIREGLIQTGMSFPVMESGKVAAVLEFYSDQLVEADEEMFSIFRHIGRQVGIVAERQRIEGLTRDAKQQAERANAMKSDFLANMSHELRTPLNSMLGMTQLLLEGHLASDQREMLEIMDSSSQGLLEVVNDILDLSKIESGNLELEHTPFNISETVESVMSMLLPMASRKGLQVTLHTEIPSDQYVLGDSMRISRVVTNLVGNAIKYTEVGQVDVYLQAKESAPERLQVTLQVADSGIGIPEQKQGSIFEKFVQADTSTTRKYGGSGLGLTITKQLVEMMQGTISLKSEVGKGSCFTVHLPFTKTAAAPEFKAQHGGHSRCGILSPTEIHLLVAEDHVLNQAYMRKFLPSIGLPHFTIVENGVDAVKLVRQGGIDIVLMDCHMPQLNGYDATRQIRAYEEVTGGHIPIVAMTANSMIGEREKCLQCGMDEYITKPIQKQVLLDVLSQWICFDESGGAGKAVEPSSSILDMTLLRTFSEGDIAVEKEFAGIFFNQASKHLDHLGELCREGYCQEWQEVSHLLKGGAATMGAYAMRELCARAQGMVTATREDRLNMLHSLRQAFKEVCEALHQQLLLADCDEEKKYARK